MALNTAALPPTVAEGENQALVRGYIDRLLMSLLDQISLSSSEGRPSITLRCRPNSATCVINTTNRALEGCRNEETYRSYSWPGSTAYESWKFTVIIRFLGVVDHALRTGQLISKRRVALLNFDAKGALSSFRSSNTRDIFYIDPAYFRSQQTVNCVVDELAYTIGVDRTALNVEAAGKGLVAGCFRLKRDSTVIVDAQITEDTMVPRIQDSDEIDISGARWVFIIEKDAIFHRLVRSSYHTRAIMGDGILITGKGYPDISTRKFVHRLFDVASNSKHRAPRFYALVDGDPHGIAIMSTYKYGSLAHLHENARLGIPGLQWLGLRITDAILASESSGANDLLFLTARDRTKIIAMLRNSPVWSSNGPEPEWRVELQRMLLLNVKAEIEMLYEQDGGLETWIDHKLFRQT
ncbi:uncharacterized protein N7482_002647 [Penicillium canariense]|uniref:DNA topoisomerase (ATP-hydrolyzing) n=1 Tax=Penicillium canariense TaxID=189055 RepID=A0A9W9IJ62_9EURO|nr:uncharacterized protein N7482_002647 [Penicillium canariense]KAJ5176770.1 hypothetical protein N7482_002647 [Penicillium canariense]